MKKKAFLKKVIGLLKMEEADITAVNKIIDEIPDAQDVELGDKVEPAFDSSLLTRERAENDPGIVTKIQKSARSEVFDKVDTKLKAYIALLDKEDADELGGTFQTYEKLDKLEEKLKAKYAKLEAAKGSGATEDVKNLQKQIQKLEQQFNDEKKQLNETHAAALAAKEEEYRNVNLDFTLRSKIFAHEFAKEYADDKEDIANLKIAKLKKDNILTLNQDGTISVQYKDETGAMRDRFDGTNKKVTIDDLIQGEIGRYVKKNNGGKDSQQDNNQQRKTIVEPPKEGETMLQRRHRLGGSTTVVSS